MGDGSTTVDDITLLSSRDIPLFDDQRVRVHYLGKSPGITKQSPFLHLLVTRNTHSLQAGEEADTAIYFTISPEVLEPFTEDLEQSVSASCIRGEQHYIVLNTEGTSSVVPFQSQAFPQVLKEGSFLRVMRETLEEQVFLSYARLAQREKFLTVRQQQEISTRATALQEKRATLYEGFSEFFKDKDGRTVPLEETTLLEEHTHLSRAETTPQRTVVETEWPHLKKFLLRNMLPIVWAGYANTVFARAEEGFSSRPVHEFISQSEESGRFGEYSQAVYKAVLKETNIANVGTIAYRLLVHFATIGEVAGITYHEGGSPWVPTTVGLLLGADTITSLANTEYCRQKGIPFAPIGLVGTIREFLSKDNWYKQNSAK